MLFLGRFRSDARSDHSRVAAVCERQRGDSYGGTVSHAWRGTPVRQRVSDYPAHVLCIRRRQIAVHFHAVRHGQFYRPVKQQTSVRLDADVLAWLKAQGKGYQTRMNKILRDAMLNEMKNHQ